MVRERRDLKAYEGRKLTVIAWLWARTVKSPNPAFADVPPASTFMLSTRKGKEACVEPVVEGRGYRFMGKVGKPADAVADGGGGAPELLAGQGEALVAGGGLEERPRRIAGSRGAQGYHRFGRGKRWGWKQINRSFVIA